MLVAYEQRVSFLIRTKPTTASSIVIALGI